MMHRAVHGERWYSTNPWVKVHGPAHREGLGMWTPCTLGFFFTLVTASYKLKLGCTRTQKKDLSCGEEYEHAACRHIPIGRQHEEPLRLTRIVALKLVNIKILVPTCLLPNHQPKYLQYLLSVYPLTCLPCTKTLVILGARLSTSLVKRLAARRTTDLVGKKKKKKIRTVLTS